MAFDFDLLKEQLVCPLSHAALVLEESSLVSCDPEKRLRYEIRDDIPIMLVVFQVSASLRAGGTHMGWAGTCACVWVCARADRPTHPYPTTVHCGRVPGGELSRAWDRFVPGFRG